MVREKRYLTLPCPECGHVRRVLNGRWLKAKREAAGIDQRQLARTIGFSGPYLSDIERNRRECPPGILGVYLSLRKGRRG